MNNDIYEFGYCEVCNKYTHLKNKLCIDCNDKDLPDIIKDLFKGKYNDSKRD